MHWKTELRMECVFLVKTSFSILSCENIEQFYKMYIYFRIFERKSPEFRLQRMTCAAEI